MYADNDLLFPPQTISHIRNSRGEEWQKLIDRVTRLPEDHPESLAFSLAMIRLNGCMECETDSYRAMRGCTPCAKQVLRRYKGPDSDILEMFDEACEDMQTYLASNTLHLRSEEEISQPRAA
ncbi:MAG: hypothetical protein GTO18_21000 [Anaerolineales bacterium]|nr:hypothetical protein [Anaerolineales bacterium]